MGIEEDPLYLEVAQAFRKVQSRLLETIENRQERMKAWKANNAIQAKIAQELKLKSDLEAQLAKLNKRSDELDKICDSFAAGVTISESDQSRLQNAKAMYEIGKKLTGVRFDHSAPSNVVKGYIKYERARSLTAFEFPSDVACDKLWALLDTVTADKENRHHN